MATARTTLSVSDRSNSTSTGSPRSLRTVARMYVAHCSSEAGRVLSAGGLHSPDTPT